ncbi:hypothetical protein [Nocardia tengchongensis]
MPETVASTAGSSLAPPPAHAAEPPVAPGYAPEAIVATALGVTAAVIPTFEDR